ncbi:MAG: hypothetical protein K1Y01_18175 [Vicinamibacteria bacterium]|nr:hypothetical protein [Vicinamibacteria bacterium]
MALYLATTHPVAPVPFDQHRPGFNVRPVTEEREMVRERFSKPLVVYLGSHTGCSCGFGYCTDERAPIAEPDPENAEDVAEHRCAQESVAALRACLVDCLTREPVVELFACWEGDQGSDPASIVKVSPEHFGEGSFRLVEKRFYEVHRARGSTPVAEETGQG